MAKVERVANRSPSDTKSILIRKFVPVALLVSMAAFVTWKTEGLATAQIDQVAQQNNTDLAQTIANNL